MFIRKQEQDWKQRIAQGGEAQQSMGKQHETINQMRPRARHAQTHTKGRRQKEGEGNSLKKKQLKINLKTKQILATQKLWKERWRTLINGNKFFSSKLSRRNVESDIWLTILSWLK